MNAMSKDFDLSQLDEDQQFLFNQYKHLVYKEPQLGDLPLGWKEVAELPPLIEKGIFWVESLQGGVALGRGWKRDEQPFEYDMLARMSAFNKALSSPSRVLQVIRKPPNKISEFVLCVFYKKGERMYISIRIASGTVIEQQVAHKYDLFGVEAPGAVQEEEVHADVGYEL